MMMLLRQGATASTRFSSTCRQNSIAAFVSSGGNRRRNFICNDSFPRLTRLVSASAGDGDEANDIEQKLKDLQQKINDLNGAPLNIQSPKQVSTAIFQNSATPVNKNALAKAVSELPEGTDAQRMALLVLEFKELRTKATQILNAEAGRASAVTSNVPEQTNEVEIVATSNTLSDTLKDAHLVEDEMTAEEAHSVRVKKLFAIGSEIDKYWEKHLLNLSRPVAQKLVDQLVNECPMGFDKKETPAKKTKPKETFLSWCRKQKRKDPRCVLLARCGDFYESFGVDSLMLIEHVGLNPMGNKARAGCPKGNIQYTLDGLTQKGFSVAVFEEGGFTSHLKERFLSGVVSPAMPTYMYNLVLGEDRQHQHHHVSRPYVGILSLATGYTLVEVFVDDLTVRVLERQTREAIACHLSANPPAEPIFYVQNHEENIKGTVASGIPYVSRDKTEGRVTKRLPPGDLPPVGNDETEWAMSYVLRKVLDEIHHDGESNPLTEQEFRLTQRRPTSGAVSRPLHLETAKQMGLLEDKSIPSLISSVLVPTAPAASKHLAKKWLLSPPPSQVAESISNLVQHVLKEETALPSMKSHAHGLILSLLRNHQASASVFGDIYESLRTTIGLVAALGDKAAPNLLEIMHFETGLWLRDTDSLTSSCRSAAECIAAVISPKVLDESAGPDLPTGFGTGDEESIINPPFFLKNEGDWRDKIQQDIARSEYLIVHNTAEALQRAVLEDFMGWKKNDELDDRTALNTFRASDEMKEFLSKNKKKLSYDVFDNNLSTNGALVEGGDFKHVKDRRNRKTKGRTTERVEKALEEYVRSCETARKKVETVLKDLSKKIHDDGHMPTIVCALNSNTIMSTVLHHSTRAKQLGWNVVSVNDRSEEGERCKLFLKQVWPYWLDRYLATQNTINMEGMWLLTAPNMAGKSTIMRSTAAAALLAVCGFCAPVERGSVIDRFDHLNVRGASSDIPSEDKSAFGAEMADVAVLLKTCGKRSLVFVDELGRGTSPRDGAALAAAILEDMLNKGMTGVFATHLHSILDLADLRAHPRLSTKRMAVEERDENDDNEPWTYKLEDGICRDSMALVTAKHFGVPNTVLDRAEFLRDRIASVSPARPAQNGRKVIQRKPTMQSSSAMDQFAVVNDIATQLIKSDPIPIPPRHFVPPSLSAESVVYVLEIPEKGGARFYVGESDNFHDRLERHRLQRHSDLSAIAFVVTDKSKARSFEYLLINKLKDKRIPLVSDADGRRSYARL